MEQVTIDKDRLEFFKWIYFGPTDNSIKAASKRAYLDMCRTIRFNGKSGDKIRNQIDSLIEEEIKSLLSLNINSQDQYDNWHFNLCNLIEKEYADNSIEFHMGQAQKWINMTQKYIYIINDINIDSIFIYLHVPLDNYVFDTVKKKLAINKLKTAWSRIDDYNEYIDYQRKIRYSIDIPPLRWEFKYWLEEAKNQY